MTQEVGSSMFLLVNKHTLNLKLIEKYKNNANYKLLNIQAYMFQYKTLQKSLLLGHFCAKEVYSQKLTQF